MYVDVIDGDNFNTIDSYRGQNANMHLCEALLCCYEATRDTIFLQKELKISLTKFVMIYLIKTIMFGNIIMRIGNMIGNTI